MRARFDGPKGTVWRLSIQGFDNQRRRSPSASRCAAAEATASFVDDGDSPVQFARADQFAPTNSRQAIRIATPAST